MFEVELQLCATIHHSSCWLQFKECFDAYQTKQEVYFQLHQSIQGVEIKMEGLHKVMTLAASRAIATRLPHS